MAHLAFLFMFLHGTSRVELAKDQFRNDNRAVRGAEQTHQKSVAPSS